MPSPQAQIEGRARCQNPRCKKLLDKSGKCWACGKTAAEWRESMPVQSVPRPSVEVDTFTGEIQATGQLMFGLDVETLTQRKAADPLKMDEAAFNRHYWVFGPNDKLTATEKDGKIIVKLVEGWRVDYV